MTEIIPEEDIGLLHAMSESQDHPNAERKSAGKAQDIRAAVIAIKCLVGFHPGKHRPLPGAK